MVFLSTHLQNPLARGLKEDESFFLCQICQSSKDCETNLQSILFALRSNIQAFATKSPFELMCGMKPKTTAAASEAATETVNDIFHHISIRARAEATENENLRVDGSQSIHQV